MSKVCDLKVLRAELTRLAEDKYREFSKRLIPTKQVITGVRIPLIRKLSKSVPREKIEKNLGFRPVTMEEVLLRGFLIARLPYEKMLKWFDSQVAEIDNWCTCDTLCASIGGAVRKNREEFLDAKLNGLLSAEDEYEVRMGLVILKCAYVEKEYLELIFEWADRLAEREDYYVKMALAWLVSECFIKYPEETLVYLERSKLPRWTFNKTIAKICDSYRVEGKAKKKLWKMRK